MGFENNKLFRKGKLSAPCLDCEIRHVGCHAHCEAYQEFTEERKALSDENFQRIYHHKMEDYKEKGNG